MAVTSARWDLEVIFPGGPTSSAWAEAVQQCADEVSTLADRVASLPALGEDLDGWRVLLVEANALAERAGDLQALAYCHNSAHTDDEAGRRALGQSTEALHLVEGLFVPIDAAIGLASDEDIAQLATGALDSWKTVYIRVKRLQKLALEPHLQGLLVEADRDGLHGWGSLYDLVTGSLKASMVIDGESRRVGVAQAAAKRADSDPTVRRQAFDAINEAFSGVEDICASALTHIVGARQTRLDRVGADELAPTLLDNRVDRAVLDAMWEGARAVQPELVRYLDRKAGMLGCDGKLPWWDLAAPVGTAPAGEALSWTVAQELILDAFASFEPELADFSRRLLAEGGVEAEDRDGKRSGGYCCTFQQARTSRIFMTFTGSIDNTITLAHELGHAWHSELLFGAPRGRRMLTPGLAESASTFAESIVRDQILSTASDPDVRRFMLDQQLQAGVAFLMNIPARFAFERELYQLRRKGPFSAPMLTETVLEMERVAYRDALGAYDPLFWATKLHFYISEESFYNWSYTFGYLFSSALYERARAEGPSFLPQVKKLLLRTGWQDCRELAADALGVDLADPAFWEGAAKPLLTSLEEFERV